MYGMTIELLERMADILQVGDSAPNHRVTVWRGDKENGYEDFPFVLPEVTRITVTRRWDLAVDGIEVEMANVNGYYSPDYLPSKVFRQVNNLPLSGYNQVIHAHNMVTCDLGYGDKLVRMFTGQIKTIDINENPPTIKFNALNTFRKLLKPIDPVNARELVYKGQTAFSIVRDLCSRAGAAELEFDNETVEGNDFSIDEIAFPLGMNYSDAVKSVLEIMNHRIVGGRHGEIKILKNEGYTQKDFHHWEFDDYVDISEGSYKIDSGVIRNRVVIMSDDGWQAFEDPFLRDYCNGEIISSGVEVKWASTLEQKWAVADNYFLSMRRKLRRISVTVKGNPSMDIGDLVQMKMLTSTANGKYIITAIQSEYSERGYIDQVDLEFAAAWEGHLCEPAEGDYALPEQNPDSPQAVAVVMTLRDQIIDYAKSFQGRYYQWGGNYPDTPGHYGLDCSHFTYQVLKKFGLMDSYRTAAMQKNWCKLITRKELLPGDLVFYTWGSSSVKHVVMYIGNGQIIGANGGDSKTTTQAIAQSRGAKVKIQSIDYGSPAFFGRPPGLE